MLFYILKLTNDEKKEKNKSNKLCGEADVWRLMAPKPATFHFSFTCLLLSGWAVSPPLAEEEKGFFSSSESLTSCSLTGDHLRNQPNVCMMLT